MSRVRLDMREKFSPVKGCGTGAGYQRLVEFHLWRVLRPDKTRPRAELCVLPSLSGRDPGAAQP